ncbi:hypothetical protein [Vallitalea guaymasensis]|uniref:DUF5050 domain-containing protein n=1 Tax=Vallitalea guaymasensis TaxID=1185412 RepID=A0A8J8MA39_9FIRM|nr:hypothetical protein [Vallitalea guaymasensis]QUH28910.1 hypothetical protein HYG85_08255 [Vallitalea guaymasensis]
MKRLLMIILSISFLVGCSTATTNNSDNIAKKDNEFAEDLSVGNTNINNMENIELKQEYSKTIDAKTISTYSEGESDGYSFIDKENEIYLIDGYEVITKSESVIATSNVKFRKKPDINAKSIKHSLYDEEHGTVDFFIKDTCLNVIGHTKDKFQVNGKENYWYYISERGPYDETYEGWAFGEYLEPIQKYEGIYVRTELEQVPIRCSLDKTSGEIGQLEKNKEYKIIDIIKDDEGDVWYHITINDEQEGWVNKQGCALIIYDDNGFKDVIDDPIYRFMNDWIYFSSENSIYRKACGRMEYEVIYHTVSSEKSIDYKVINEWFILAFPIINNNNNIILCNKNTRKNTVIADDATSIKITDTHLNYICNYDYDSVNISIEINDLINGQMMEQYPFKEASIFLYDDWAIYDNNIMYKNTLEYCDEFYYYRYPEYIEPNIYIDSGYFVNSFMNLKKIGEEKEIISSIKDDVYQYDYSDKLIAYVDEDQRYVYVICREDGHKKRITDFKVSEVRVFNGDEIYYKVPESDILYCYKKSKHSQVMDKCVKTYEIIGDYIYFVDTTDRFYRMKFGSNKVVLLSETQVGQIIELNNEIYYYLKYDRYNVIYKITNDISEGEYIRLISEMDFMFSGKGNIYYHNSKTFTNLLSIKPITGQLPGKVIHDDERCGIFTSYTGWDERVYVYNKDNNNITPIFDNIHYTGPKVCGNWVYGIECSDMSLYRSNMETKEKQKICNNVPNDFIFHVVDNKRMITLIDDTNKLKTYNIFTKEEQLISIDCAEILWEYNNEFYYMTIDNRLMKVSLNDINIKEQLADNVKLGQMYNVENTSPFCMLVDLEAENLNDYILYINTNDELIKLDIINGNKIKIADNCYEILQDISYHFNYEHIYYIDKEMCLHRSSENVNEKISTKSIIPSKDRYEVFDKYIVYMMPTSKENCVEYIKYDAVTGESEFLGKTTRLVTSIVVKDNELYYNYHHGGSW